MPTDEQTETETQIYKRAHASGVDHGANLARIYVQMELREQGMDEAAEVVEDAIDKHMNDLLKSR